MTLKLIFMKDMSSYAFARVNMQLEWENSYIQLMKQVLISIKIRM